jgi:hypothetical protein
VDKIFLAWKVKIMKTFGEKGQEIFLLSKTTGLVLGPTHSPNSVGSGVLPWG